MWLWIDDWFSARASQVSAGRYGYPREMLSLCILKINLRSWVHPARLSKVSAAGLVMLALAGGPAYAWDNCDVMAPGLDGVLRLDTGKALTWPCVAPGVRDHGYDVGPDEFEMKGARPKDRSSRAKPESDAASENSPSHDEIQRLKTESASLKEELARTKSEASRLRSEAARFKDQLATRDAAPAGKLDSDKPDSKSETSKSETSKLETSKPEAAETKRLAPKGDLLIVRPRQTEVPIPPQQKSEAQLSEQHEFDRRKTLAEQAWQRLIDFAARMKEDLSGKR